MDERESGTTRLIGEGVISFACSAAQNGDHSGGPEGKLTDDQVSSWAVIGGQATVAVTARCLSVQAVLLGRSRTEGCFL